MNVKHEPPGNVIHILTTPYYWIAAETGKFI